MSQENVIYDVNDWRRCGRGMTLDFFATDEEVQNWLLTALPSEYSPYTLVGTDSIKQGKIYVEKGFEFNIDELKKAMYEKEDARWRFWIRSKVITPELDFSREKRISWVLSYTGMVNLQHGGYIKNMGHATSGIGIVNKIRNDNTGEEIEHKEYLKVYNALKREIKKHLCYSSMWRKKDGTEYEDCKFQLMTEKAFQAAKEGYLFKNSPGRRLK